MLIEVACLVHVSMYVGNVGVNRQRFEVMAVMMVAFSDFAERGQAVDVVAV